MRAWYNEIDRYCCDWLSNLMDVGHITPGVIDDRSIADVSPDDIRGFERCHFFAGIAGWELALQLAGWPADRPVWTGSCPCQPFSRAGQGKAADDERHLWPAWMALIRERRPARIFGEQVEAAIGWGWLDVVFADLEAEGYACGAAVLPACGLSAPHIRQRLWFVGHTDGAGREAREPQPFAAEPRYRHADEPMLSGLVADANGGDAGAEGLQRGRQQRLKPQDGGTSFVADSAGPRRDNARQYGGGASPLSARPVEHGATGLVGDPDASGLSARQRPELSGALGLDEGRATQQPGLSPWSDLIWLPCSDGKARPTQSILQQMVDGLPDGMGYVCAAKGAILSPLIAGSKNRVGRLRAYGNAIVPSLAAEFIKAAMEW